MVRRSRVKAYRSVTPITDLSHATGLHLTSCVLGRCRRDRVSFKPLCVGSQGPAEGEEVEAVVQVRGMRRPQGRACHARRPSHHGPQSGRQAGLD